MTIFNGNPDRIIGDHYLERYYVIPRNRWFSVYLHKFLGSDDDRACHDHPWASVSFLLAGRLIELTPYDSAEMCEVFPETEVLRGRHIPWLWPVFRKATHTHRMVLFRGPAYTLFITGPKVREWGFLCAKGWKHWSLMTTKDGKQIGGCE